MVDAGGAVYFVNSGDTNINGVLTPDGVFVSQAHMASVANGLSDISKNIRNAEAVIAPFSGNGGSVMLASSSNMGDWMLEQDDPGLSLSGGKLLWAMYAWFQVGGGKPLPINAAALDFSGTNQRELGLDKLRIGETRDPVNLFNTGVNSLSLAFGQLRMTRISDTEFSIAPNRFDFDYQPGSTIGRNSGTILAFLVNYNLYPLMLLGSPLTPVMFGGPYYVIFKGNATIPK